MLVEMVMVDCEKMKQCRYELGGKKLKEKKINEKKNESPGRLTKTEKSFFFISS